MGVGWRKDKKEEKERNINAQISDGWVVLISVLLETNPFFSELNVKIRLSIEMVAQAYLI